MRPESYRCGNCVHAAKIERNGVVQDVTKQLFQCQRFPPQVVGMTPKGTVFGWPIMAAEQWCGEFSPNEMN